MNIKWLSLINSKWEGGKHLLLYDNVLKDNLHYGGAGSVNTHDLKMPCVPITSLKSFGVKNMVSTINF